VSFSFRASNAAELRAKSAMHQLTAEVSAIHMHEPARQRAHDLVNTPAFANAQRERKKVEALFAELKE
jgi:hypothetical protein